MVRQQPLIIDFQRDAAITHQIVMSLHFETALLRLPTKLIIGCSRENVFCRSGKSTIIKKGLYQEAFF